jgi:transposase
MGRSTSASSTFKALETRKHWPTVEWLPKCAPELNDIEVVWHDPKAHHLAYTPSPTTSLSIAQSTPWRP